MRRVRWTWMKCKRGNPFREKIPVQSSEKGGRGGKGEKGKRPEGGFIVIHLQDLEIEPSRRKIREVRLSFVKWIG